MPGAVVGVLTGVTGEGRCLMPLGSAVRIAYSGADPQAAERLADELAGGTTALVSFGLAGGLDPALRPGTLLLPPAVILADGSRVATDADWVERLGAALDVASLKPQRLPLAESDRVLATPADKRAFATETGAAAVDMESGAVARAAVRAGLPFLILRAVADPAGRGIPAAALAAVGPGGRLRLFALLGRLLAAPQEVAPLLRLAGDSRAALQTLRRAVGRLGTLCPAAPAAAEPADPRRRDFA